MGEDPVSDSDNEPLDSPDFEHDNQNEAIVPPDPADVPATRLSQFRCGGPMAEYPAPNGAGFDSTSVFSYETVSPCSPRCGGADQVPKENSTYSPQKPNSKQSFPDCRIPRERPTRAPGWSGGCFVS